MTVPDDKEPRDALHSLLQDLIKSHSSGFTMDGSVIDLYTACRLLWSYEYESLENASVDRVEMRDKDQRLLDTALTKQLTLMESESVDMKDDRTLRARLPDAIYMDAEVDDMAAVLLVLMVRQKLRIRTPFTVIHQFDGEKSIDNSGKIKKGKTTEYVKSGMKSAENKTLTFYKEHESEFKRNNTEVKVLRDDTVLEGMSQHSSHTVHTWSNIVS